MKVINLIYNYLFNLLFIIILTIDLLYAQEYIDLLYIPDRFESPAYEVLSEKSVDYPLVNKLNNPDKVAFKVNYRGHEAIACIDINERGFNYSTLQYITSESPRQQLMGKVKTIVNEYIWSPNGIRLIGYIDDRSSNNYKTILYFDNQAHQLIFERNLNSYRSNFYFINDNKILYRRKNMLCTSMLGNLNIVDNDLFPCEMFGLSIFFINNSSKLLYFKYDKNNDAGIYFSNLNGSGHEKIINNPRFSEIDPKISNNNLIAYASNQIDREITNLREKDNLSNMFNLYVYDLSHNRTIKISNEYIRIKERRNDQFSEKNPIKWVDSKLFYMLRDNTTSLVCWDQENNITYDISSIIEGNITLRLFGWDNPPQYRCRINQINNFDIFKINQGFYALISANIILEQNDCSFNCRWKGDSLILFIRL